MDNVIRLIENLKTRGKTSVCIYINIIIFRKSSTHPVAQTSLKTTHPFYGLENLIYRMVTDIRQRQRNSHKTGTRLNFYYV